MKIQSNSFINENAILFETFNNDSLENKRPAAIELQIAIISELDLLSVLEEEPRVCVR